jgi:AcrR family transcriptional regulator
MFTENSKPRKRGRPRGETVQGAEARERLYRIAVRLMAKKGFESTTLRDVAAEAGVSAGLLYRYFPNKRAVIVALYDELSADFVTQAAEMPAGRWRDRFMFAVKASLKALDPHRTALKGLVSVLVGDPEEGVFSESTAFSRERVQRVFTEAVIGSTDAPGGALGDALGRLLYLAHLAVLLWWLLDKSAKQRSTRALVSLTEQLLPSTTIALKLSPVRRFVISMDELFREALLKDAVSP